MAQFGRRTRLRTEFLRVQVPILLPIKINPYELVKKHQLGAANNGVTFS